MKYHLPIFVIATLFCAEAVFADVSTPAIFSNHMVLQREQKNRVWGWANPGEKIRVGIAKQMHETTAGDNGAWSVILNELPTGGPYTLSIKGENELKFEDVLVGEVWICSGQSNMAFAVGNSDNADLETLTAKYPNIRLISVPQVGTQEPQKTFKGEWARCTPETVANFSAVGYYFGRQLHQTLDVPIGLIDNAWGGSAAEAWVRRDQLKSDERYAPLLERWKKTEAQYDHEAAVAAHQKKLAAWMEKAKAARQAGNPVPPRPRPPRNVLVGQHRPGNLYNGVLKPTIGYGIRGVIWYQGESNSSRAYQYRHLFPLMIQHWRDEWGQGDFPFYWVQLADFRAEVNEPGESDWAELREAQTMTMNQLKNTGQAVITDLGEAADIHPKNKQRVAKRLARWALANQYDIDIAYRSPEFESVEFKPGKAIVTMKHVGKGLDTFDVREVLGVTLAGEDRKFHKATARIVGKNQLEVSSPNVKAPVSVRYAWADNPVANLQSAEGLPATPFRSDDWEGVTANNHQ